MQEEYLASALAWFYENVVEDFDFLREPWFAASDLPPLVVDAPCTMNACRADRNIIQKWNFQAEHRKYEALSLLAQQGIIFDHADWTRWGDSSLGPTM
jgi:hypothetical protein